MTSFHCTLAKGIHFVLHHLENPSHLSSISEENWYDNCTQLRVDPFQSIMTISSYSLNLKSGVINRTDRQGKQRADKTNKREATRNCKLQFSKLGEVKGNFVIPNNSINFRVYFQHN